MSYSWTCPFCERPTTITDNDVVTNTFDLLLGNKVGPCRFRALVVVCPNPNCKQFSVTFDMTQLKSFPGGYVMGGTLKEWQLLPASMALTFPDYVPSVIRGDYEEACLIRDLSPKASATLARRALQGMIRDFWKISKGRLIDEVAALQDKVDPITWAAIDAVRSIGNIGAHMEKDINFIVDVEVDEAKQLIQLLELLVKDWYIARHDREVRLQAVIAAREKKEDEKKAGAVKRSS